MSEFQYVAFRAIDGPLSDTNLEFMEKQSTRAEITRWTFDNEYHFGDFRGDAMEMLRRGYDLHLHYANFGVRKLFIHLPYGLPDPKTANHYLDEESFNFVKDKKGKGGILCLQPYFDAGDLEEIWAPEELLDDLIPLRAEILNGDLRPLYIAHLAVNSDGYHDPDEMLEAPVPAGLKKPTKAQQALANFYGISEVLLLAAAQKSKALSAGKDTTKRYQEWLKSQTEADKTAWLLDLLTDPDSSLRAKLLAKFQEKTEAPMWPTTEPSRTISELIELSEEIQNDRDRKAKENAEKNRRKRIEKMAADPKPFLKETEKLVELRSTNTYEEAATLLAEVREALTGTSQAELPDRHAEELRKLHPKSNVLVSVFRKYGFLSKK